MFDTAPYWIVVLFAAALTQLLPSIRTRSIALCCASVVAMLRVFDMRPAVVGGLVVAVVWVYVGLVVTRRLAERDPLLASFVVFAPLLVLWAIGKEASARSWQPLTALYFIGFSFFLVKAWTLIKDVHDRRIPLPDGFVLAAYFFFFPTWISGPMHHFREFQESIQAPRAVDGETLVDVVFRVLVGLTKLKVLVPLLTPISLVSVRDSGAATPRSLLVGSVVYSAVIWADFSGYTDVAIASGRLAGISTPENFRLPYAAPNPREFWQRWHITFSRVLTSYLFIPISRALQKRMPETPKRVMAAAYLLTFGACGYWHGATANFVLWGVYHAAGLIAYDLLKPAPRRKTDGSPAGTLARRALAVFATFLFVSFGWIFFVLPTSMLLTVLRP